MPKDRNNVTSTPGGILPCPSGQKGEPLVVPVLLSLLDGISHLRIFLPKDLRPLAARETVWKSVLEVHRRCPDGIGMLDPIENMQITDEKFKTLVKVRPGLHAVRFYLYTSLENPNHGGKNGGQSLNEGPSSSRALYALLSETRGSRADTINQETHSDNSGYPTAGGAQVTEACSSSFGIHYCR